MSVDPETRAALKRLLESTRGVLEALKAETANNPELKQDAKFKKALMEAEASVQQAEAVYEK